MNNKLVTTILANAGYSNPEVLAQIINAVPNTNVALEMLLGVYVPIRTATYLKRGTVLAKVSSVDALSDILTVTEYEQKSKQVWYLTKEDRDLGIHYDEKPSNYYDYSWVKAPGVNERPNRTLNYSNLENWTELTDIEFHSLLDEWKMSEPFCAQL